MRILIIENEQYTSDYLRHILDERGIHSSIADNGEAGLLLAAEQDRYDLILLGADLPDMDGYQVLQQIRATGVDTPIIFTGDLDDYQVRVWALNAGADRCYPRPWDTDELMAQIGALHRLNNRGYENLIVTGGLALDLTKREVRLAGNPLPLTVLEYNILKELFLKLDQDVSKQDIIDTLYGAEFKKRPQGKTIEVLIGRIRQKIGNAVREIGSGRQEAFNGTCDYIETTYRKGYRLVRYEPCEGKKPSQKSPDIEGERFFAPQFMGPRIGA